MCSYIRSRAELEDVVVYGKSDKNIRRRRLFLALPPLLFAVFCIIYAYRGYAAAFVWHCIHGSSETIGGGKTMYVPKWWFKVDSSGYGESMLVRADGLRRVSNSRIVTNSLQLDNSHRTEEWERESVQSLIRADNEDRKVGWYSSLVIIKAVSPAMYCKKDDFAGRDGILFSSLQCYQRGIPYSFSYQGSPKHEKEAELILSTLR